MARIPLQPETRTVRAMSQLVIALMVMLGLTVLAGAAVLRHVDHDWRHAMADRWTLELPPADPAQAPPQASIAQALTLLRTMPGIRAANVIGAQELNRLLQPWLGDPATVAQLPLPVLIDIAIDPERPPASSAVLERIRAVLPDATLDDHGAWTRDLSRIARTGEAIGAAFFLVIVAVAVLTVAATARARLAINRPEIELLHYLGASDAYISHQFESSALRSAVVGAAVGTVVTGLAGAVLVRFGPTIAPLSAQLRLDLVDGVALAAVPIGFVMLATLATRSAARALMRRLT